MKAAATAALCLLALAAPARAEDLEWDGDSSNLDLGAYEDQEGEAFGDEQPRSEPSAGDKLRESIGGTLRLVGVYFHTPEAPDRLMLEDDGLGAAVGRLLVDHRFSNGLTIEANAFLETTTISTGLGGGGGTYTTVGNTESVYRYENLVWTFWDEEQVNGRLGLDRLALRYDLPNVSMALGRFPVNHSVTMMFTINDFFAPFAPTAINQVFKPGVDAFQFSWGPSPLTSIELDAVMGYRDGEHPEWGQTALIARASTVLWKVQWSTLLGKLAQRWVVGGSLQGDLTYFSLRGEGHVGFRDENGDLSIDRKPDGSLDMYGRFAVGVDRTFAWKNAMLAFEYGFYGDGATDSAEYLPRATRLYPDDLPFLAQHYLGLAAGLEITPLLRLQAMSLLNVVDLSGVAGPFLQYSLADEVDLITGFFAAWGDKPTDTSLDQMPPDLRGEFSLGGFSMYLEMRAHF